MAVLYLQDLKVEIRQMPAIAAWFYAIDTAVEC